MKMNHFADVGKTNPNKPNFYLTYFNNLRIWCEDAPPKVCLLAALPDAPTHTVFVANA